MKSLLLSSTYSRHIKIYFSLAVIFLFPAHQVSAQTPDSTKVLDEVVISAYQSNRTLNEIPASIGVIDEKELIRFSNTSLLPSVNTIPGVRMEERSPGSYRFAVRGSSLRSPFGVRNVKFYWNGLPMTDGGGNTYLNLLDFNSVGSLEIIKGPGASLYGAGTGGVVLLKSPQVKQNQIQLGALYGSYGLQQYSASIQHKAKKMDAAVRINWQQADGYRQQSEMTRGVANIDLNFYPDTKNTLSATVFTSLLGYQTPGGLTKVQYEDNAQQARPGAGTSPGAVDQKAKVNNNTTYAGLSHQIQWTRVLSTHTGIYGSLSDFKNPTIRNYEKRDEKNGGMRTTTQYVLDKNEWKATFTAGAELQFFSSEVGVYGNDHGTRTQIQTMDALTSQQYLFFAQSEIDLPYDFILTIGASINYLRYKDQQSITAFNTLRKNFDPDISPRIALLKNFNDAISLYSNISRGFSPPTFAEALPSTGVFNPDLSAERGISYEAGVRGKLFRIVDFDIAAYNFQLNNAIVIQRDADGADYFVNAGKTNQKGLEGRIAWSHTTNSTIINLFRIWSSATINHYRFERYEQSGADYSGNMLTGVAPDIIVAGLDIFTKPGFYLNITANYTDHIALNDANTEYAADYILLGAKLGFLKTHAKTPYEIFVGIDNALDQKYSLGNDLNAVGGRFYNAAAPRNFYAGVKIALGKR